MTLMAFFATFRERDLVDLLLSYGANPDEITRRGPSVKTLLEDPETVRAKPYPEAMNMPERRASIAATVLKLSEDLRLTPEAYVSRHRNIMIWSFGSYAYDDPALAAWASRVRDLLGNPDRLEAAYRAHLTGEAFDVALRSLIRPRQRAERERRRQVCDAEFEAFYFASDPPQSNRGR